MAIPELLHFEFSHYNEKARWALDYKGVPHVRRSVLPGPHKLTIQRLTGQAQVPVLRLGDEIVTGSSAIIARLERDHPEPPLYPTDEAQRRRAFEIRDWFDEEVGPQIRLALFFDILPEPDYPARMFSTGKGAIAQRLYRMTMPVAARLMRREMKITAENAEASRERTREALDFVIKNAGPTGYLVGERFSVADLTAASILMLSVYPPELQPALPQNRTRTFEGWLARWADHPGTAWVADMYARHRGRSAEVVA